MFLCVMLVILTHVWLIVDNDQTTKYGKKCTYIGQWFKLTVGLNGVLGGKLMTYEKLEEGFGVCQKELEGKRRLK